MSWIWQRFNCSLRELFDHSEQTGQRERNLKHQTGKMRFKRWGERRWSCFTVRRLSLKMTVLITHWLSTQRQKPQCILQVPMSARGLANLWEHLINYTDFFWNTLGKLFLKVLVCVALLTKPHTNLTYTHVAHQMNTHTHHHISLRPVAMDFQALPISDNLIINGLSSISHGPARVGWCVWWDVCVLHDRCSQARP